MQIYPVPDTQTFLIDTPGFDDTHRSDSDILQAIASCLADLYEGLIFDGQEIHLSGIIFVHAINEPRMTGAMMTNLKMLHHIVGKNNWKNLTFVTSKWVKEDPNVAANRESELKSDPDFWKGALVAGAKISRFGDSQRSALDVLSRVTAGGTFVPQLTKEYAIDGIELCKTTAGRAIDEQLAKARDKHEVDLAALRQRLNSARQARDAQAASQLRTLEAQLKVLDDELGQLRTTREEAQDREDELDSLISHPEKFKGPTHKEAKHRARKKRALRWFGRFAAMGAALAMSVLTHGAMVPVGVSLVAAVETLCQQDKDRELQRKAMKLDID